MTYAFPYRAAAEQKLLSQIFSKSIPAPAYAQSQAPGGFFTALPVIIGKPRRALGFISLTPPPGPPGPGPAPVPLLTAGGFEMLAKSGISTVPASAITGNIGISPIAATGFTGFAQVLDGSGVFATSPQVVGEMFAADYAPPTPANLTQAVLDMQAAYTNAASRVPNVTGLNGGLIGGLTLPPGVYRWSTGVTIASLLTLAGGPTSHYIFQVAGNLTLANAQSIALSGGQLPQNVFWQVAGLVHVGTTAHMVGIILSQTQINMLTGSTLRGRLYAQTAITLDTTTAAPT